VQTRPFISFREFDEGGAFRPIPEVVPASALDRAGRIVLLIHGFNNNAHQADEAYSNFFAAQSRLGYRGQASLVEIYWPGDTSITGYHRSIPRAKTTAERLASLLRRAASRRRRLTIDVVAHSMGCRLTLELIKILQKQDRHIKIGQLVFMAAAVPVRQLEKTPLRSSFERAGARALSLFSPIDEALGIAFRLGQQIADSCGIDDSGTPPLALGASEWRATPPCRQLQQREAVNALHGDYWPGHRGTVATHINRHLGLGGTARIPDVRIPRQRFVLARSLVGGALRKIRERFVG